MSDAIKHECGIAMVRLLKPLQYYKDKYGTALYGVNKMYLLMEKQHNRGQDGAGFASIKFDVAPGTRYISRIRSNQPQPIKDIFGKINNRINGVFEENIEEAADTQWQQNNVPYLGNLFLGHLRYGTFGGNSIENVHPFLRQRNWRHQSLLVAGNFNMTNSKQLLNDLIDLGQHPKEATDTVTVMEKIGHFLEDEVSDLYVKAKEAGFSKKDASPFIEEHLDIQRILQRSAKNWDGGYAMAGLLGHGDAFVLRDPSAIRPAFYYQDDEVVVVASERPAIQTVFNVDINEIKEIDRGHALIIKKSGETSMAPVLEQRVKKACSFERIYFSRGSDADIYTERKNLGKYVFPEVLKSIDNDIENAVFSYIPNTAETSFFGMMEAAEDVLNQQKTAAILAGGGKLSKEKVTDILSKRPRFEKIAIKDAKLRTFITDDSSRDDLVAHVYDVTYGVVKPTDNLVIIDDSIVRGTTLKKSIIKILDRLNPKKIVVVSSAPQIRYPDCYGIDMAKINDFIAFKAALELLKETDQYGIIDSVYAKCKKQQVSQDKDVVNYVKEVYAPFTDEQISAKIAQMLKTADISSNIEVIFQNVESLHKACPDNLGDWYFTGDYPTDGGNRVVNQAFINFYEGNDERAY
ncbi:amidophosphoribosyltransferase [Tenacibaculum finnmarkense]|uniref:amidophosphoribosyltransferase n=1 Tax=Tenacibaculum finnmarkense TaxID=2781243 RepID=UPI001E4D3D9D|nr:amidophosphoribosyltransferase [Tenacibaculum finnmarkense]MCD8399318.1 amidophosphoribosyltransferase [Tenacibaculum finnmarkense genomovar ulcerans]MCD8421627.1 amidophosphoribosyltransferase [Tenacibaculum finnmarkense genomovar ulcerans]MCG8237753.1 amidophosphoribosyltransferase [Tenacibaculum finnmarkense genomovar ulcerans]MCG8784796.1 amidophosphoribosyltransferase [Tenacibaculum finnmarkense]MCG8813137.1 amidophosphoribosyltransferase [Tenacibaculum finnmarkense]